MGANIQSYQNSHSNHTDALSPTSPSLQSHQDTYVMSSQSYWKCYASGFAMTVSLHSRVLVSCEGEPIRSEIHRTAFASMMWVVQWVLRLALGQSFDKGEVPTFFRCAEPTSRQYRRLDARLSAKRHVPVVKRVSPLFWVLARRMARTKSIRRMAVELMARLSGFGRVRVYGLRRTGSVLRQRALLTCYNHGWWRIPVTSTTNGGMWDVQLPDN